MDHNEIMERLITICSKVFEDLEGNICLDKNIDFVDELGMDSITFITLIIEIEVSFDITIPDELLQIKYFKNLECICVQIADLLQDKTPEHKK